MIPLSVILDAYIKMIAHLNKNVNRQYDENMESYLCNLTYTDNSLFQAPFQSLRCCAHKVIFVQLNLTFVTLFFLAICDII